MRDNGMEKKFCIGISLEMEIIEYEKLIEQFSPYISTFYFSPPLGDRYHTRTKIAEQFHDLQLTSRFYNIINLIRNKGFKLDCVLNRPTMRLEEVQSALKYLKCYMEVDQITCLQEQADYVREQFPDKEIIYSYNNDLNIDKIAKITKLFDTVVVGKYFLRSPQLLKKIYEQGFEIKLLVNNGCSYNCGGCKSGSLQCDETVIRNLEKENINYLYALQSFYPHELHNLLECIDIPIKSIKISNRTSGYQYLKNCLQSYVENRDVDEYVINNYRNYRLWCRLGELSHHFQELNNEEINKYKREINVFNM